MAIGLALPPLMGLPDKTGTVKIGLMADATGTLTLSIPIVGRHQVVPVSRNIWTYAEVKTHDLPEGTVTYHISNQGRTRLFEGSIVFPKSPLRFTCVPLPIVDVDDARFREFNEMVMTHVEKRNEEFLVFGASVWSRSSYFSEHIQRLNLTSIHLSPKERYFLGVTSPTLTRATMEQKRQLALLYLSHYLQIILYDNVQRESRIGCVPFFPIPMDSEMQTAQTDGHVAFRYAWDIMLARSLSPDINNSTVLYKWHYTKGNLTLMGTSWNTNSAVLKTHIKNTSSERIILFSSEPPVAHAEHDFSSDNGWARDTIAWESYLYALEAYEGNEMKVISSGTRHILNKRHLTVDGKKLPIVFVDGGPVSSATLVPPHINSFKLFKRFQLEETEILEAACAVIQIAL